MKRKIIVFIAVLILSTISFEINSQLNLTQQFGLGGTTGRTELSDIIYGSDGFIYLVSTSTASGTDGNISVTSYGVSYILVTKLNSVFDIIWQKSYGGNQNDYFGLAHELPDGILLTATSSSGVSGNKTVGNNGSTDGWVFKIDFNGDILWQKGFGGNDVDGLINSIVTSSDEIYLGFRSTSSASGNRTAPLKGGRDFWIAKLNSTGDILWDYSYGSSGEDDIQGLIELANGNIVAAGTSLNGNVSFDKTETPYGFIDNWLVCIDTSGVVLWDKTIGGNNAEFDGYLASELNDIYLLATSSSDVSGLRTEPLKGTEDLWVSKLDQNGNILWMNYFGGNNYDKASSLYFNQNMLYINSYSMSDNSFDKTEDSKGGQDNWIIVADLDGNIIIDKTIGGSLNDVSPKTVFYATNILMAGSSYSDISGDKTVARFNSDLNEPELWLVEIDASTLNIVQPSMISPSVYPNPVVDYLNINLSEFSSAQHIELYDYQGKLLFSEDLSSINNPNTIKIDLTSYPSGVFTFRIYDKNMVLFFKVIK